jgi:hypothetical protein
MSARQIAQRFMPAVLAATLVAHAGSAAAIEFQIGENTLKIDNLLTIGGSWRMQDRDEALIGKSTLFRMSNGPATGLCFQRPTDDGVSGADPALDDEQADPGTYEEGSIANGCAFSDPDAAEDYAQAPGSYAPNGDNGNLNFDKHDLVHAVAKLTSDISFSWGDYNFFVRPIYYFDANYTRFSETHPDTTFYPRNTGLPEAVEQQVGSDLELLDYHASTSFDVFDRSVSVKVGNQVLNWGESSLLLFNSLNTVNALDATKIRFPGSDLKEFFQPQGMVVLGTDLVESISVEGWYAYQFKEARVDPVGTYFSQSDTLGAGGNHAMLGFGKNPDDPLGIYEPVDSCSGPGTDTCADSSGLLGSTASRTIYRDFAEEHERRPDDGGYGVAVKTFLEGFNNGTEVAFYYANYPSRFPIASLFSSDETCIGESADPLLDLTPAGACGVTPATATEWQTAEPVPVDTARLVIEYPEGIDLYGLSFNTTIGDYALSGEYAYRPNLPVQIHTTDLTLAALNPAVPQDPVDLNAIGIPLRLPGRREAFPDFVSVYRGINGGYGPNEYIRGYERLEVGQANLTILKLIGGDNPIGASQMTMLFEMGMNQVFNMPGLDELQFQGGGVDTHISDASDGTEGINPDDPYVNQDSVISSARQNPTAHKDLDGFGASESYGYRVLNLNRWDSALFGANLETLTIIQHDVKGTTPGIGTNFIQGRKQFAFGLRFDYLSTWIGEVRYSWNTGGAKRDSLRDRDNIAVSLGVQF